MITWNEMEVLHAQQLPSSTGESYIQHEQACALLIHWNYDVSDREFVQLIQKSMPAVLLWPEEARFQAGGA